MGDPPKPIEEIAAEEIAADEERSHAWVAPKLIIGMPAQGEPARDRLAWIFQFGPLAVIGALVLAVVAVLVGLALLQPGRTPSASASPTGVAAGTATPESTQIAPIVTGSPGVTPAASLPPFAVTDPQVDEVLDDGTPIDDPKVDIVATIWQKLGDRIRLTVKTTEGLTDPPSAADVAYIGSYENVASGIRLAGLVAGQEVQPFHAFLWQLHDGALTIGRIDPDTLEVLAGEAQGILITRDGNDVIFEIPFDQLPPIVDAYQVYTFHRAALADPMRSKDQTDLIELPEPYRLP